jgi:hypothetical protein
MSKKLLAYEFVMHVPFGDAAFQSCYKLTILQSSWFGLIKRVKEIRYTIPYTHSVKNYLTHWDELIKTQKPLC